MSETARYSKGKSLKRLIWRRPHSFLAKRFGQNHRELPPVGDYGSGGSTSDIVQLRAYNRHGHSGEESESNERLLRAKFSASAPPSPKVCVRRFTETVPAVIPKRYRSERSESKRPKSVITDVFQKCMSSLPTVDNFEAHDNTNLQHQIDGQQEPQRMGGVCSCLPHIDTKENKTETICNEDRMCQTYNNHNANEPVEKAPVKEMPPTADLTVDRINSAQITNYDTDNSTSSLTPKRNLKNRVWTSIKSQIKPRERATSQPTYNSENACGAQPKETVFITAAQNFQNNCSEYEDNDSDFVIFRLRIHLKEGRELVVRDASGSSDPYVKVKYRKKTVYKSNTIYRNLNPNWDEEFAFLIDDPTFSLQFEVFDFDRFMADDFMGSASVDLAMLRLFDTHELKLNLEESGNEEYMGFIHCHITITPLTEKQKQIFMSRAVRGFVSVAPKRPNKSCSVWLSTVNVVLVEAKLNNSNPMQSPPDVYAKFKLGSEKHKSKVIAKSFEPKWSEQFDLHIFDENLQVLNVMIHDKSVNNIIGKCSINLSDYEKEKTEQKWHELEGSYGKVLLLLTISGSSASETVVDLQEYSANRDQILNKYSLMRSFQSLRDVGYLTVKVYKADNLAAGDINGKSDPFCVLELVNVRLQTHTVYKTLNPEWNKLFTFSVKDIHESLEVTVYDEDPNKKFEFLGKVVIPLLKISNCEKRWYALRDRKLTTFVKGRILLEMDILWNPVKAALRSFNPRERKFIMPEQKFKRQLLIGSVNRIREFGQKVISLRDFYQSCLSWESYTRSITAFLAFIICVYFIELWHFPLLLLLFFLRSHIRQRKKLLATESAANITNVPLCANHERGPNFSKFSCISTESKFYDRSDEEEECEDSQSYPPQKQRQRQDIKRSSSEKTKASATTQPSNEKSSSLRTRVLAIQDTLTLVQNSLDFAASLLERTRNTFNFTVSFLSYLAIFILIIAMILLYFISFRWILMAWGVNKFTKRLRNPHYVENNEILDFLSRVPSDKEFKSYHQELHRRSTIAFDRSSNTNLIPTSSPNNSIEKRQKRFSTAERKSQPAVALPDSLIPDTTLPALPSSSIKKAK